MINICELRRMNKVVVKGVMLAQDEIDQAADGK